MSAWPAIAVGAGAGVLAGAHLHAMFRIGNPLIPGAMCRLPAEAGRSVLLTFDDGPHPEATPAVLDVLGAADVRAVFFMIGMHAARWPDIVAQVASAGHEIGNHGYTHRYSGVVRGGRFWEQEIGRTSDAIHDASGVRTRWFRPAIGHRNFRQQRAVRRTGHRTLGWSCRSRDGVRSDVEEMCGRIMRAVRPRDIVLVHDGVDPRRGRDWRPTVALLRRLLPLLDQEGYGFASSPGGSPGATRR